MKIDEYIEQLKEQTKSYNEIEKLRYVYLNLGKIMSFNPEFIYGPEKKKISIYKNISNDIKELNKNFEEGIIICKSLALILKYILNNLNIKTDIYVYYDEGITYEHVNNIVTLEGEKYIIDLQQDLKNIQIHSTTDYFLMDIYEEQCISKSQLKKIDEKIGYITEQNPYIEEYLYEIKKLLKDNLSVEEKLKIILDKLTNYINTNDMGYYEIRRAYYSLVSSLLPQKERIKIKFVDGYKMGAKKEYSLFIYTNNIIYMYNNNKFNKITLYDTSLLIKNGYILLGDIPGLKKILKK